jgi:hypothetical protein
MGITLAKVRETFVEKGKLIIKSLTLKGASTAKQVTPFGIDSNPLENWTAIYADTTNAGEAVILGYINKDYITKQGEIRIYSIGEDKAVKAYVYARKDGVLELNGSAYSGVRFQNLKTATDANDSLINAELTKIAAAITLLGGTYIVSNIATNLSNVESSTVKLK